VSKFLPIFLSAVFLLSSCSSTTTVQVANDPQAKIYIDDEYVGKGTATHTDTKIIGSNTRVKISKEGCQDTYYNFSRNEEFDVGACIGGVLVLVPFLWIQKYKPTHQYEYNCEPKK
jgi:hypothetical protein